MPPNLGRLDSDTTHVSDSEPEREARRRARHNSHSSTASSAPNSPAPQRMPLSAVSNTLPVAEPAERPALDCRLSAVEGELAEIKVGLAALRSQKRSRTSSGFESGSPPSTPLPKRARIMCHRPVGPDSPVGRLDEPRIHRSSLRVSTPEREEITQATEAFGSESKEIFVAQFTVVQFSVLLRRFIALASVAASPAFAAASLARACTCALATALALDVLRFLSIHFLKRRPLTFRVFIVGVDAASQTGLGVRIEFLVPNAEYVQDARLLLLQALGQKLKAGFSAVRASCHNVTLPETVRITSGNRDRGEVSGG
ncbi:hypothetical protein DFH09DRAFT_1479649 [Mycena vulgaris]|nr:hypothetical protein DFH09DRAFT_1479649 [Mycena vulgaris]